MNPYGSTAEAFITGYERLGAWSGVLDEINVFPVADGDTGRNLMISLAPLRGIQDRDPAETRRRLLFAARGNSGNIAARFVVELLSAESIHQLPGAARTGSRNARSAVHDPRPGTMLTVLDRFADALADPENREDSVNFPESVIDQIQTAVHETPEMLPELKEAGVVDAGALGMFLFLEGFLKCFSSRADTFRSISDIFGDSLKIAAGFSRSADKGYCVDFVVRMDENAGHPEDRIAEMEDSALVYAYQDYAKVHLHTNNAADLKQRIKSMGHIVQWSQDDLVRQTADFRMPAARGPVHIVTDAAGSLTRHQARRLGITLLESYVTRGETCAPETCIDPETLYHAMRDRVPASTSQASIFERHQHYERLLARHQNVLYLCVGSVYTGNYQVAVEWKKQHDPEDRLTVIDTGAASGRLAAAVIATARYAARAETAGQVIAFAQAASEKSGEYIFLDELKYLAAGGRMSKTGAFFGDMMHVKPVITPTPRGAEKVGIVRNTWAQLRFAVERLSRNLRDAPESLLLLEYTDNRKWVEDRAAAEIRRIFPKAEIRIQPLSLTSGVHIGPGAWAVAYYGQQPEQGDED
ncbi:MAG: DegV family EDD domain-containing protein [Desulfobacterales bacterium]|nr:DegV family EDD domain-containing protein [Desulfobacterales bacterium]MBS3754819.1 DegV family EDD domain-containing protein [Desulfobacterales bacterium]